jgi:peptide/nickel transport system substrate-binding protein
MKLTATALGLCVTASLLAGCGGDDDPSGGSGGEGSNVVDGGSFTMALSSDPGNLDPHSAAGSALFTLTQLAYDSLLSVDSEDGAITSQLATDWTAEGTTVTLTLAEGATCADGTELTATAVADNIAYVGDPKNESPFLGTFLPVGATAEADDESRTVTLTLVSPAPFVLNGLASLPIVCPSGMEDRKSLADGTAGTGPYELTEAVPGAHYTYQIRDDYTWGPDGATTATEGMPDTITMKIVANETTSANLLLSGDINAAQILGPDAERLDKAGLFSAKTEVLLGEQWYNHAKGHATSDPEVRMALTQALDLAELQSVLTAGKGTPATTLSTLEPSACPGDSASGALPASDPDAAKATLSAAGLPDLTFLYDAGGGSAVAAAAELAVQQWKAAGVTVTAKAQDQTALQGSIFGTGDWDIAWVPLNVNSPDQLVPFLSGPAAPDGTNFAAIANEEYDAGVKEASALPGEEGCDTWLEAESKLIAAADVVPFANSVVHTFGAKAEFETPGQLVPTSIRMQSE